MADRDSNLIANQIANPRVMTALNVSGGKLREKAATVEVAAADDAEDTFGLFRVKSSDRISQLLVGHDAIAGLTTADIGIFETAANGGAAVDADFFADAVDMSSASSGMVDRTYERANTRIADIEKPLWEQLGLTADPGKEYDIRVAATTNEPTGAGTISALLRFADNS